MIRRLKALARLDVPRFVGVLAAAAASCLLIAGLRFTDTDLDWLPAFLVLAALSVALEFVAVELPRGGTVSVATMSHTAAIILVPAPFAALLVGSAVLIEELVHRRPPTRVAFNVSNYVLTVSLASLVVSLIGDPSSLIAAHDNAALLAMVVLVSLVYYVVNDILTSGIMALTSGRSIVYLLRTNGRTTMLAEAAAGLVGVLFAVIWVVEPLWTVLLVIPGAVIARAIQYIRQLERETIEAVGSLSEAIDHRDPSTFHHSERVADYAVAIARELDLDEGLIEVIEQGAKVHDLGKIGVPDRMLLKPGPLNAEEQTAMWLHAEIGSLILGRFRLFGAGASIVRHHHEAYDGSGYPDGLAGAAIPIGARVVAVADALDAMTSDRPYRRALSLDEALARCRAGAGSQWDPVVIAAMLRLVEEGRLDLDVSRLDDNGADPTHDHAAVGEHHEGLDAA